MLVGWRTGESGCSRDTLSPIGGDLPGHRVPTYAKGPDIPSFSVPDDPVGTMVEGPRVPRSSLSFPGAVT